MLRSTSISYIFALAISCFGGLSEASIMSATSDGSYTNIAFAPSTLKKRRSLSETNNVPVRGFRNHRNIISAYALPSYLSFDAMTHHVVASSSPSFFLPSTIISYDEAIPAEEAFQDQVSLSDLTSDPVLQIAFAASVAAIILLFVAKAIVTSMDEAVGQVALDFDRVMKLKYPKKWAKFIESDDEVSGEESEADRIQRIVEEMEILSKEEPEFMERVMQDIERMKR